MKLLFLTNVPAPYRVDFFNELGKYCDLTVLFEKVTSSERDESWKQHQFINFKGVILKGYSFDVDSAFCPSVIKYLKPGAYDYVIVADFLSPTGMLAVQWMRIKNMNYWLESDGGLAKDGKGLKEKIKSHFMRGAGGYFSTAETHDNYYLRYGAEKDVLIRYPFTSLHMKDIYMDVASLQEKNEIKNRLDIAEKKMILSVGRFSYLNGYGKGYDALVRAAQRLPEDIGWYIVGGEPTEEFACMVEETGCSNIHFVDFLDKESLKEYYRAADIFALMTVGDVWGLVINEAMACGLPVITTDKCVAGMELVTNGENGYIVKVGDDEALARHVSEILDTPGAVEAMGARSLQVIRDYTIENMARKHMEAFEKYNQRNKNEDPDQCG